MKLKTLRGSVTGYDGLYGAAPPQKGYPFSGFRYLKLYGKDFSIPYYMKFSRQVNFVNFTIQKKKDSNIT